MDVVELNLSNVTSKQEVYEKLETFWSNLIIKNIEKSKDNFYVEIIPYGKTKKSTFILNKSNLYVIGYVVGDKEYYFKNVSYKKMNTEVRLLANDIMDSISLYQNVVNEYDTTKDLVKIIAFISEAARFDFVRAVIKRGFFPSDKKELGKYFIDWDNTVRTFCHRVYLNELVTNYDKMKNISQSKNISINDSREWCQKNITTDFDEFQLACAGLLPFPVKKCRVATSAGYGLDDITILTNSSDNTITFCLPDGRSETYSMTKLPKEDSYIIQVLTKNLLNGLQIDKTIDNLDNIAGLLTVAAAALTGTPIKSQVTSIQYDYTKVCGNENETIEELCKDCRSVAMNVGKVYDKLVSAEEDEAIVWLRKCEKIADEMADKTQKMADSFITLSDKAELAVEGTENEVYKQKEKADELRCQNEEYQAALEKNKVLQEQINDDLVGINESLQKAVEEEEAARKKKHGFEIAGLVGNMVSGIVDMFTPDLGNFGRNDSSQKNIEEANKQEIEALKKELEEATADYEKDMNTKIEDQAKVDSLNAEIANLEKQKESATGDQLTDIENKLADSSMALLSANAELEAAILAVEVAQQKMEKLQKSITELVERCDSIKDSAALEEEKARQEKEQIYAKKMELEEERRDCLSSIAEFSVMIENTAKEQQTAETALRTLTLAASCIKDVVQTLLVMVSFWRSISRFCKKLNDTDLDEEIESNMKVDANMRVAYYYDSDFMLVMLKFLCQWGALFYVCKDFANEMSSIPAKQNEYYGKECLPSEAAKYAEEYAEMLNKSVSKQIEEQDAFIEDLKGKEI